MNEKSTMTDTPKYEHRDDELGLDVYLSDTTAVDDTGKAKPGTGYEIEFSHECWYETREAAEQARQEYALAIANSVHGAEIARLRAVLDHQQALLRTQNDRETTYLDLLKRLRAAMIDELRITCTNEKGIVDAGFSGGNVEVFDEASIALGLPLSNDDGVPFELLPPAHAFKPSIIESGRQWIVRWGSERDQRAFFDSHDDAAEAFGERYAAWKASQR